MNLKTLLARGPINTTIMVSLFSTLTRPLYQTPRIALEIERKFTPTSSALALLRANAGTPPFTKLAYLGQHTLNDTYFDKDGIFLRQGIYVRLRNSSWEVKVTNHGANNQAENLGKEGCEAFTEYTNLVAICRLVRGTLQSIKCGAQLAQEEARTGHDEDDCILDELNPIAKIHAKRDEWDIDGFRVVIDETQWGYCIGEVELTRTVSEDERVTAAKDMDEDIMAFMEEHPDVFSGGKERPMGKLSAYWRWEKENGCEKAKSEV